MNELTDIDIQNVTQEKVLELALLIPKLYENELSAFGATDDMVAQMLGISRDEFSQLCVNFEEVNRASKLGATISRAKTTNYVMSEALKGNKMSGQLITYMLREIYDVKKSVAVEEDDKRVQLVKSLNEFRIEIEKRQKEIRGEYKNITYADFSETLN